MPTSEASSSTSSHWAWRLYAPFAMVLGLGSLAILCLVWTPFALVAQWIFPPQKTVPIGRLAIHYVFRIYTSILEHCCGCRFDLKDLEAGQTLHVSQLAYPQGVKPVMHGDDDPVVVAITVKKAAAEGEEAAPAA